MDHVNGFPWLWLPMGSAKEAPVGTQGWKGTDVRVSVPRTVSLPGPVAPSAKGPLHVAILAGSGFW